MGSWTYWLNSCADSHPELFILSCFISRYPRDLPVASGAHNTVGFLWPLTSCLNDFYNGYCSTRENALLKGKTNSQLEWGVKRNLENSSDHLKKKKAIPEKVPFPHLNVSPLGKVEGNRKRVAHYYLCRLCKLCLLKNND